jgi:uncharacterized protein YkwD
MIKNILQIIIIFVFVFSALPIQTQASSWNKDLAGKILIQVENNGEAWYVDTASKERYFLNRPSDAFQIMNDLGLGISESDYLRFQSVAPERLWGRIVLRVESLGEAYYIDTKNGNLHYLSKPVDAFKVMVDHGVGISNHDLSFVPISNNSIQTSTPLKVSSNAKEVIDFPSELELKTFYLVNDYRASLGLNKLTWNDEIAIIAREHSQNMGTEKVLFGHDGFLDRSNILIDSIKATGTAENVAYNNGYEDPASQALSDWLASSGHKVNIEGDYDYTAIGIYVCDSERIFFTQIFTKQ